MNKLIFLGLGIVGMLFFVFKPGGKTDRKKEQNLQNTVEAVQVESTDGFDRAYFASGCFWCVEAVYESVRGVQDAISGYSGGKTKQPTYGRVGTGLTGHAEAIEVIYDPEQISFSDLVDVYFASQNITQANGQGGDRGSQYRSILFYQNAQQKQIIDEKIEALNKELSRGEVAAEVYPFQEFWIAESYHQNFERRNPTNGYVRAVSIPRLHRFQAKRPDLLKSAIE